MSTALVIIDVQNDYFSGGRMELVNSEAAASSATLLLKAFRQAGWPVIHIRHISLQPGASFFLPDTVGTEIYTSVAPLPNEQVITKHFPNSFRETGLLDTIRNSEVDSILFCGMMTHMCIDATVRAAFDLGFTCTVAHDACATRDLVFNGTTIPAEHVHASFLAALGAVYAQVKATDDILTTIGIG